MRDYPQMGEGRWRQIDADFGERLTAPEVEAGWHFCPDLDGRLIHPSWIEYRACRCGHGDTWQRKGRKDA